MTRTHIFIPDTQCRPGVPMDHLGWAGRYILERKPDVVVHAGDHWDMESLSSWDRGTFQFEGRRVKADIQSGNTGLRMIDEPVKDANRKRKVKYEPEWYLLGGNHEDRIRRFLETHPEFIGVIGDGADAPYRLDTRDWTTVPFLTPLDVDGVSYCHYWPNPMTGKPYGGQALTRLKTLGHTYVQGHQQIFESCNRFVRGRMQRGVIAGAFYLHDEDYKGVQGNAHWRGLLVFHEVDDGAFDIMEVSMDYLCRRYEGVPLREFLNEKYPDHEGTLWR